MRQGTAQESSLARAAIVTGHQAGQVMAWGNAGNVTWKCHLGHSGLRNSPNCAAFLQDADELVKRICLLLISCYLLRKNVKKSLAERVGFEPTCRLPDNTLSRRARYDHFGTSPRGCLSLRELQELVSPEPQALV